MDRSHTSRVRERVERFLAEDHPKCLSDLRDFQRRHPESRLVRSMTKTQAGIVGAVETLIPVLHLMRARRGVPAPLETLRHRCWAIGFQAGIEVDARHDFECVLDRWARKGPDGNGLDASRPEPEELAEAVARRLRASRFWKIALGFVPVVGPVAAYRIDAALALRFHDRAKAYFRELRSAGVRPRPDDFERLLHWAGRDADDEAPMLEDLVAAVSAKLRRPHLWKLALGFLPVIGPLLALMINDSMAARFYRLTQRHYEQRRPPIRIAR